MTERRREFRYRTYLGGLIAFNNRCSTLQCLVRNLSQDGARLVFSHPPLIPHEFELSIAKKGDRYARVVWQKHREAGVAFAQAGDATPPRQLPGIATAPAAQTEPVHFADGVVISFEAARLNSARAKSNIRREDDAPT